MGFIEFCSLEVENLSGSSVGLDFREDTTHACLPFLCGQAVCFCGSQQLGV
jgi:hypothetical protein